MLKKKLKHIPLRIVNIFHNTKFDIVYDYEYPMNMIHMDSVKFKNWPLNFSELTLWVPKLTFHIDDDN